MSRPRGLISLFMRHQVAANLLMLLLVLMGGWSLRKLNTQFLPTINLHYVVVNLTWPGASSDDVEKSITTPIEKELRDLDHVKEMTSLSSQNRSTIIIEFLDGTDMGYALDQVNEKVALVRNLPTDAKKPVITRLQNYEPIAKLILTGGSDISELRQRAYFYERELISRGISKVEFTGLPEEEIAIQIPSTKLAELKMSLNQVAQIIRQRSQDTPSGNIGKYDVSRQLRAVNQRRSEQEFYDLPLITDQNGRLLHLKDIATVTRRPLDNEVTATYQGKPAIQMQLLRAANASALQSADILNQWLKEVRPTLPQSVKLIVYDPRWTFIKQRITILLENGFFGFALILIILFVMLNRRIAFWVAMGIPVSLMTAMIALYLANGSMNMVSMFAFIMTLGIIVDDTIVVAEEALTQMTKGKKLLEAIEIGAYKMLAPISASSLTTIAAFFPLMFIGGVMGTILRAIPLVVICVILASLLECFFILPGHLHHSLKKHPPGSHSTHTLRRSIDSAFERFKAHRFHSLITKAIKFYGLSLSIAIALFLVSVGLIIGKRVNFTFFPQPEGKIIRANVEFAAGTPRGKVDHFMVQLEQALNKTSQELSEKNQKVVQNYLVVRNTLAQERLESEQSFGDVYSNIYVELTEPDSRPNISNNAIISNWRNNITLPPEINNLTITAPRVGPPGKDLEIRINGLDWNNLKRVSSKLKDELHRYHGVTDIKDDLPLGQEQIIYDLSNEGKALGLTTEDIGKQLRAAFNGEIIQVFHEPNEEVEVRVMLPDNERYRLHTLDSFPIITGKQQAIPLQNAITTQYRRSLDVLRHSNTLPTVRVSASIDSSKANANNIIAEFKQSGLINQLEKQNATIINFVGRAEEQRDAIADMKVGAIVAFSLIYIILAWVFNSYSLPILIMLAIPLGITGAVFGHYLMNIDFTILSLFGVFGLSGIVINDSIILVNRYLEIRGQYDRTVDAIVEASCQRLRAVLLTSLTTIAGLTPLLFETSVQAQFLIPMAVSITFGLFFSTLLVLVIVPCLLLVHHRLKTVLIR